MVLFLGKFEIFVLKTKNLFSQAIFDDSDEYVNIFNRKYAQSDFRVRVVRRVLHPLRMLFRKVHHAVRIQVKDFLVINARYYTLCSVHLEAVLCELVVFFSFVFRLKMTAKMMQYLNAIKRPYHVAHQLRQIIIIKC